jgi:putative phosphoesterase
MRILLVSDVHSNWPALAAVREPFDVCLCLGDVVDYGADPAPCVDWVRRTARVTVRGNHDHCSAHDVSVDPKATGYKYLTGVSRVVTRARLGPADLRYLAGLPLTQALTLDHQRYFLVHATPRDPLDEVMPADAALWARRLEGVEADIVCVGHTHQQYVLEVGNKLVVNPGSVGLPREGDPRAAYAIVEGRSVKMHRVEYPVEEAVRAVEASPMPETAKAYLAAIYRTGSLPNGAYRRQNGGNGAVITPPPSAAV